MHSKITMKAYLYPFIWDSIGEYMAVSTAMKAKTFSIAADARQFVKRFMIQFTVHKLESQTP